MARRRFSVALLLLAAALDRGVELPVNRLVTFALDLSALEIRVFTPLEDRVELVRIPTASFGDTRTPLCLARLCAGRDVTLNDTVAVGRRADAFLAFADPRVLGTGGLAHAIAVGVHGAAAARDQHERHE
jgi:hypothetical protein